MWTSPWCTTRFSPRFLNVLRGAFLPPSAFFSVPAASVFAIRHAFLDGLLLRHCTFARTLAGAGVGARALSPDGQVAPVPQTAVAADFHQPLDVHRDLLAEVALDAAHFLEHAADLADVVLGERSEEHTSELQSLRHLVCRLL